MTTDFNTWTVPDMSNYLKERGISVSLRRKLEIVRLCELADELELEMLNALDDYQMMDTARRTVPTNSGEKILDDVITIKEWGKSLSNLPDVDFCHIFIFLMKTCSWQEERLKCYKNDNSHRLFLAKHVDNVMLSGVLYDHYQYVRATCVPETRQSAAPYNVWVLLNDTGEIHSGGCSCVVDNGTCKHCVALLFGQQSFCARHKDRSTEVGTDVECKWDKPRKESIPMEVDSIDIRKDPSQPNLVTPTTQHCKPAVNDVNTEETARQLKQICKGTSALLLQTLYTESDDSDEDECLPTLTDVVRGSELAAIDAINSTFDINIVDKIEAATRGQSDNPAWFSHRHGRITASIVPSVMSFRYTNAPENYITKKVLSSSSRVSSASLEFGKMHEPIARQMYTNDYTVNHQSADVTVPGLFIDHENPFLGASPDGAVSCKCCGSGLLEIKCSFTHQNKTPGQACVDSHYHVYLDENNDVKLKTSSSWDLQIQAQLVACKKPWCDFVLFTKKGFAVDRILFDKELYDEIVSKSRKFFETYIVNAL